MKKVKYFYNTHTLRFEKLERTLRAKLLRVFGFVASSIVTATIMVMFIFRYIDSPKEKILRQQNDDLRDNYAVLQERVKQLELKTNELEDRDNDVYRAIFEATPVPDSARMEDMERKKEVKLIQGIGSTELVTAISNQLNKLSLLIAYQEKSFDEIGDMLKNKEKMLMAIPSIQPISNKELKRIGSGYGHRIDPIYKTDEFHKGLDFTAPAGTPIYATANGTVIVAGFHPNGYGNQVVINHGYGYQTLYAHMYSVKVHEGEQVNRGEVIGYVGSTGKSTGPHCHYEVHKNGTAVDPVYYFYNDLTPDQYDRMLKLAAAANQSFD